MTPEDIERKAREYCDAKGADYDELYNGYYDGYTAGVEWLQSTEEYKAMKAVYDEVDRKAKENSI